MGSIYRNEERAELGGTKSKEGGEEAEAAAGETEEGEEEAALPDSEEEDELESVSGSERTEDEGHQKARRSRQKKLVEMARQQQEEEEARKRRLEEAKAAHKVKMAESKHLNAARKRLDEEQLRIDRREEAIERDFRRLALVPRLQPLGRDRFFDKYWWLDGLGSQPVFNAQGQAQYLVGRLYVQGASELDLGEMEEMCEEPRRWQEAQERMEREYGGAEGRLAPNEWAVYTTPEEVSGPTAQVHV